MLGLSLVRADGQESPLGGSGLVRDIVGRALSGVEILVFPSDGASMLPLAERVTDEGGRFTLQGLNPGNYLIALNKPGYRIQMARVNSRLLSLLRISLEQSPARSDSSAQQIEDSMDWVLKMPRTDVLKEQGPDAPTGEAGEGGTTGPSAWVPADSPAHKRGGSLPINGEVSQWYTSSLSGLGSGSQTPQSTGRRTHLMVGGDLPGQGGWEFRGALESLTTQPATGREGAASDQGANRMQVAMHYDLSPEDSVQFKAHFDRDLYQTQGSLGSSVPVDQEVRTLGYQARWNRRIGAQSDLDLGMTLLRSDARLPESPTTADEMTSPPDLSDLRWSAGAGYQVQLPKDHRLSVAARTRVYRSSNRDEGWILAPAQSDTSFADIGDRGWAVTISGEDSWKISEPVSLILGLDTHVTEGDERSVILVPRMGARRDGKRTSLVGWVLMKADHTGASLDRASSDRNTEESGPLGYRAEIEQRLARQWILGGHLERNPVGASGAPVGDGTGASDLVFLSDARSWTEEIGFYVSKSLSGVVGTLESDHGWVVGRVAEALTQVPIQALEEGRVRYVALRATASMEKTETRVHLGYARLDGWEESAGLGDIGKTSRMDLTVFQPISFVSNRGAGSWKVLLGYQTLSRDPGDTFIGSPPSERVHRFSGGVGVSF